MKRMLFIVFACVLSVQSISQNVGIGTTVPDASAKLDVSAIDKGMLVPRMSSGQRAGIISPATGLLVFDTDTKTFWVYNGTIWTNLNPANLIGTSATNGLGGVAIKAQNSAGAGIGLWSVTNSTDANTVISNSGSGDLVRGFSGPSAGNLVFRLYNNGSVNISDGTQGLNRVLTSDAAGNSSWRALPGTVSFKALNFNNQTFGINTETRINATLEDFDLGSNFFNNSFTAPSSGVYHFDVKATVGLSVTDNDKYLRFYLRLKRNGTVTLEENIFHNPSNFYTFNHSLLLNTNVALTAGDVVTITFQGDANPDAGTSFLSDVKFSEFKVN